MSAARVLRRMSWTTAIAAVTLTPLMGFVVGDKRPSAAASALHMLIAVLLMLASLALTFIEQYRRASAIRRRAVTLAAERNPVDRFAVAREQAHGAGLPWLEADGSVSWPSGGGAS